MNENCFCSFITCFALTEMFYQCGKNKHHTVVYPLAWEHAQATHLRHVLVSVPQNPFHISWSHLNHHQGHSGNCGCRFMLHPLTLFTPWPLPRGITLGPQLAAPRTLPCRIGKNSQSHPWVCVKTFQNVFFNVIFFLHNCSAYWITKVAIDKKAVG